MSACIPAALARLKAWEFSPEDLPCWRQQTSWSCQGQQDLHVFLCQGAWRANTARRNDSRPYACRLSIVVNRLTLKKSQIWSTDESSSTGLALFSLAFSCPRGRDGGFFFLLLSLVDIPTKLTDHSKSYFLLPSDLPQEREGDSCFEEAEKASEDEL